MHITPSSPTPVSSVDVWTAFTGEDWAMVYEIDKTTTVVRFDTPAQARIAAELQARLFIHHKRALAARAFHEGCLVLSLPESA